MSVPAPLLRLLRGTVLAKRYRLLDAIGHGGMGTVFEAIDLVTDRVRAIKIIGATDTDASVRFQREALVAGRARSTKLVEITDYGHDESLDVLFLVMERLHGRNLGVVLRDEGPLEWTAALEILGQVCEGLTALHDEDVVHRDLKPENVVLTEDSETSIKVVDFGLAKSFAAAATSPNTTRAMGTPLFMAPEQLAGDGAIDHRADIYSFGHLAYALLVGEPYFTREYRSSTNLYALLQRVSRGLPEEASVRASSSSLPSGFDGWFRKATAPDADHRFDSIDEAYRGLKDVSCGKPAIVPRLPIRRALGAVALVALASAGVFALRANEPVARATQPTRASVESAPIVTASSSADVVVFEPKPSPPAASSAPRITPRPAPRPTSVPAPKPTRHDPLDSME